jgi:hypothetical protein
MKFMHSLDMAFMARRGMTNGCDDDWGKKFFDSCEQSHGLSGEDITLMYAAASRILNQFACRRELEEYSWTLYQNPRSFSKIILAMVRNGMLP